MCSVRTILSREWVLNQREMQEGQERQERCAPEGARKKRVSVPAVDRPLTYGTGGKCRLPG